MRVDALRSNGKGTACRALPHLTAVLLLLGSIQEATAQDSKPPIFAAARQAVAEQKLIKSKMLGFGIINQDFSDIPEAGGVLVGFDIQLIKAGDNQTIHALRAVYRTDAGEITSNDFGIFADRPRGKKIAGLTRSIRVQAPPGYAVGSITVRSSLTILGMQLKYQRVKGCSLLKEESVVSDWIGSSKHVDASNTLGGNDLPIVGIFGNQNDARPIALGIFQLPAAKQVANAPAASK